MQDQPQTPKSSLGKDCVWQNLCQTVMPPRPLKLTEVMGHTRVAAALFRSTTNRQAVVYVPYRLPYIDDLAEGVSYAAVTTN